ncbi:MAG TPA: TRAP transporter large permease [Burkholderiales bacterium]|nr:TRAP transporter large permease [Burkholderiales bacterium]
MLIGGAFLALFALLFAGVPIAFALFLIGTGGSAVVLGWQPALAMVGQVTFDTVRNYNLATLPLFILMGNLVARARLSTELYEAAYAFLGHRRGGLAMTTILASGGFAAVCGSSMATASTMARVAMPSMRAFGYADSLAAASIAAGGTLGILIPPSVIMVIYGIMTNTNIGALFIAGVIPGLIGIVGYLAAVGWTVRRDPAAGKAGAATDWAGRWRALRQIWGIAGLFLLVLGGIYLGVFTPIEAAGVGAFGAFVFAVLRRTLGLAGLREVFAESTRTAAVMLTVLIGAVVYNNFLDVSGFTKVLQGAITAFGVHPLVVIAAIVAVYLVLGCILESLSMVLLTVPVFFPVVTALGYDPVWFGIIVVVVTEISLITPPVGFNVFMLNSMLPEIPVGTIFRGLAPFIVADIARLALFILVPVVVLWLPRMMDS